MAGSGLIATQLTTFLHCYIATPLLLHSLLSYIAIPQEFSTQQLPRAHCTIAQLHSLHVKDKDQSEFRYLVCSSFGQCLLCSYTQCVLVAYIGLEYCTSVAKVLQKYRESIEQVLHNDWKSIARVLHNNCKSIAKVLKCAQCLVLRCFFGERRHPPLVSSIHCGQERN